MGTDRKITVGIVGMEFGAEFIPIYQRHPKSEVHAICQRTESHLRETAAKFGVGVTYTDYAEMLKDPDIDLVHVNTPLQHHADHVVAALEAGKHVGCTIPMATSVEDCKRIVDAQRATGLVYMMMETVVYSREFLFVREAYESGQLGKLQFLRSSHQQDMTGWPDYWDGMPPMHNATHAISPTLALGHDQAEYVQCLGSGRIFESMTDNYDSPHALETTHIKFKDSDLAAEVTRSLWAVARQYRESFDVYGAKRSFEWTQVEGEGHLVHTGEEPVRIHVPDYASRLPEEVQSFTRAGVYNGQDAATHRSFTQGGGHGGSHPHLVDRLLRAVAGEVDPYPSAVQAANITCSGILSHQSAMNGGARIDLPDWTIMDGMTPTVIGLEEDVRPPWANASPLVLGDEEGLV